MKFSHTFRVLPGDIDAQGHVNNVAYVRWIQDVAVAHWQRAAAKDLQETYAWVVTRHEIDYKRPAFENEEITATTWVGEWTAATCERFTEIRRGADLLVSSRTMWCMIDRLRGRPSRITEAVRGAFK